MAGRPGFFGGIRSGDAPDRDADLGFGGTTLAEQQGIRLGDNNAPRFEGGFNTPPGFDPIWGTLGAPAAPSHDDWATHVDSGPEGLVIDVEVLGDGFQVSGEIHTGQFDRLSDWINMQSGFIQVYNAWHVHLGQMNPPDPDRRKGMLWVRLSQVVLVAEKAPILQVRPGAPMVQKQRRKVSMVTPGYNLSGNIHVVAYGSMTQFLEITDPHFMPMTDLAVHWLSDPAMVARFPFAMINRGQLVTVLDEATTEGGGSSGSNRRSDDDMPLQKRWSAAS
ncbi:MAG TPA: hypothetical protein VF337_07470 [Candidatus Limnocylindrales bacterium]